MEAGSYLSSLPKESLHFFRVGHLPHVFEFLKAQCSIHSTDRAARLLRTLFGPWLSGNDGRPQQWQSSLKIAKPEKLDLLLLEAF